jgi:hypothetical protein
MPLELKDVPAPPEGSVFRLLKLEKIPMPHPYMVGPAHLKYSDSMYLDIERAEERGARCYICKRLAKCRHQKPCGCHLLTYAEHENPLTLFVGVPQNGDLNAVPGLHTYLLQVKNLNLGIEGFAFPLL